MMDREKISPPPVTTSSPQEGPVSPLSGMELVGKRRAFPTATSSPGLYLQDFIITASTSDNSSPEDMNFSKIALQSNSASHRQQALVGEMDIVELPGSASSVTMPLRTFADGSFDQIHDDDNALVARILQERGQSSIMAAVLNFTNSIVGAGIIGLPYALKQSGFWSGIALLLGLTFVVDWTVRLLVRTAKLSGTKTYQDLVEFCFGRRGFIAISICQFVFAFGAMCAYVIIVGDTLPLVLDQFLGHRELPGWAQVLTSRRSLILLSTLFVSLPLSLLRDISKLANASAAALVALVFIVFAVVVEGPLEDPSRRDAPELAWFHPNFFQAISVISFAFVCHHNSFLIYSSLQRPTLDRWSRVTHYAIGVSLALSLALGISGYLNFGHLTKANILNNFSPTNTLINLARICFAFNMFTTYPLECFVCREVIEHYFFPRQQISQRLHVGITLALVLVSLANALLSCNLGIVLELTGCFSATTLAYILPPLCYIKLSHGPMWSWSKAAPILCVICGVVVMAVGTVSTFLQAFSSSEGTSKDCRW